MRKIMFWAVTASLTFSGVALANNPSNGSHTGQHHHDRVIKLFASTVQFNR